MPANLPPEYYKLKHELEAARTDEERLQLLEEMTRITPKHKGTEKVRADIRSRISKLKKASGKKQSKKGHSYHVPKQGAGQLVLIGTPNVGKSQIVASFTKANPAVSPTPYTTQEPSVGMLQYENIQFQLVDTPPITQDFVQPWVFDLVRNADLVWLVVSLASDELLDQVEIVQSKLTEAKIEIAGIKEPLDDANETFEANFTKTTLLIANQTDADGADDRLEILREFYGDHFQIYPLSAITAEGLDQLQEVVYQQLGISRVYTKSPAKPIDYEDPIVLPNGSKVIEAAMALHKEFAQDFKSARIWGDNWYDGQTVSRDDVVYEGDVLEFHV
jgi:ribosome-interacting GTPase 1